MRTNKQWYGILIWMLVVILLAIITFFTVSIKIPVGYSWIAVDIYAKNVEPQWLSTWRHFINPITHDFYKYPVYIQQKEYSSINFQDEDWLVISADIGMDYKFDEAQIWKLYSDYRSSANKITNTYMRTWLKDAVNRASSKYKVDVLYGMQKEEFRQSILTNLKADLDPKWIIVDNIYFVDEIKLPREVEARINAKIEATQNAMQKENELRAVEAEAQKQIAEAKWYNEAKIIKAEADAKAIQIKSQAITSQWGAEYVQLQAIEKWDWVLPVTSLWENVPFINLK